MIFGPNNTLTDLHKVGQIKFVILSESEESLFISYLSDPSLRSG
jgi:hypothetical protein